MTRQISLKAQLAIGLAAMAATMAAIAPAEERALDAPPASGLFGSLEQQPSKIGGSVDGYTEPARA